MKTQYKFEHLPFKEVSEYFPLIPLNDMYMVVKNYIKMQRMINTPESK